MKHVLLSSVLSVSLLGVASAQSAFGINFKPMLPNHIIRIDSIGGTVPGTEIASVSHYKLTNNYDGEWTTALTVRSLTAPWGGDGTSAGVLIGRFDPYLFSFVPTTEAAALNSASNDIHLALSEDGKWAIFERVGAGLFLAHRSAIATAFGSPVAIAGSPGSGLTSGEVHPYLGQVGGVDMCFYSDGNDLVMQPILLSPTAPALLGTATIVASEVQGGAQPGSPSPLFGPDGDVEGLFACDIVLPQTGPGSGDADPVVHSDLDPTTPGVIQVQRTDWQGFGGLAGGFIYFSHDISAGNMHLMHGEGAILLGDSETPGGVVDLRVLSPNWGTTLFGTVLFGAGVTSPAAIPGWKGGLALTGLASVTLSGSTNRKDGIIDLQFATSPSFPAGVSIPIQAATIDAGTGYMTLSNTAWIHL